MGLYRAAREAAVGVMSEPSDPLSRLRRADKAHLWHPGRNWAGLPIRRCWAWRRRLPSNWLSAWPPSPPTGSRASSIPTPARRPAGPGLTVLGFLAWPGKRRFYTAENVRDAILAWESDGLVETVADRARLRPDRLDDVKSMLA